MMSDDLRKPLYLGFAAAGVALSAYIAYRYWEGTNL